MMSKRTLRWNQVGMVVAPLLVSPALPSAARAVGTVEVRPVRASGVQGVDWQFGPGAREITLVAAGQDVAFDVFISNWAPELLGTEQVGFSCSRFTLLAGELTADGVQECSEVGATPGFCWEVDTARMDYIFSTRSLGPACQFASVCPTGPRACGDLVTSSGVADPGVPRYAMTVVYRAVDAGIGSASAFIDPVVDQNFTFLTNGSGQNIGPDTFLGAIVTFGPLAPPPICGDNVVNQASEQCDGTDAAACPGQCRVDCTCPTPVACAASCDNGGGGSGTRATPAECLTDFCRNPIVCGCGSLTQCTADGVSVLPPSVCGDGEREGTEECDPGFNAFGEEDCSCPGLCQTDCTCPGAGGSCAPDGDNDGIQDAVDAPVSGFLDTSTTPATRGGIVSAGDQDLCISDAPSGSDGVRAQSLGTIGGGPRPATLSLLCFGAAGTDIKAGSVTSGNCITMTCRTLSGMTKADIRNSCSTAAASSNAGGTSAAQAAAPSDVDLTLLASGRVVGTVVLPDGNALSYDPVTLTVTAPATNTTTLTVVTPSGASLPLSPGGTVTPPAPSAIPAASTWGLLALGLTLLVGAKVYFGRRRRVQA